MSEDQNPPEPQTEQPAKADTSTVFTKLLLLVAIVFALTKWGLPFMNNMVDEFKKTQDGEQKVEIPEEKLTSGDAEPDDEEKLKSAIENEINLWIQKQSPDSSATVKFINANDDSSKLAVEYLEKNAEGELQSKEILLTKDEFGIYIYEDVAGVRQIRVRQPQ